MARLYPEISHFCMEYPEEMFRRGEKFNHIQKASSPEFVGEIRFREFAKLVI